MKNIKAIYCKANLILLAFFLWASGVHAQYQTNGSASQPSCECFVVTPEQQYVAGSVWNITQIDLTQPFDFTFDIFLGCTDWQGADGMAFVLQPLSINAGAVGFGLGYQGIAPSLAVEYDTFWNDQIGDISDDHIAITTNGEPDHTLPATTLVAPVPMIGANVDVEDCVWHTTRITWNPGTQTYQVFFDGVLRASYTGDIINNIFGGNPMVYWGFTGSTGDFNNEQQFCIDLVPDFTIVNAGNVCPGVPIQFEETSTASNVITDYSWDFGDNTTGTGQNVNHTYSTGGTYDVTLTITSDGCPHSVTQQVTILDNPVVDLGPDLGVCDGESVQLNMPNIVGNGMYSWDPPTDLDNASIASPTATPAANITYTLTYTENGCDGTDDITLTVSPAVPANAGPDVSICVGESAQLAASGGFGYQWDNTGTLDVGNTATPVATPATSTVYTVTVTDANNCSATDDVQVTVNPLPAVDAGQDLIICAGNIAQLNATGVGTFTWDPDPSLSATNIPNPNAGPMVTTTYTVTLTDANNCSASDNMTITITTVLPVDAGPDVEICSGESVQLNGSGAVNYSWTPVADLDNALISDPVFTGTNSTLLTLTGTDGTGCSATDEILITVHETPVPVINVIGGLLHCDGELVSMDASNSTGPITDYLFNFGDQVSPPHTTSSAVNPTFTFPGPSSYTVTLVTTTANCSASTSETIDINAVPVADFSFTEPCAGELFSVTDNSSISAGVLTNYSWDFGDGATSTSQAPAQIYVNDGTYDVELIVGSNAGCSDTLVQSVNVLLTPEIVIAVDSACLGEPSLFTNASDPNDNTVTYAWDLGDGTVTTDFLPFHTYGAEGNYGATLTGISIDGCVATGSAIAEVNPIPEVNIGSGILPGCAPYTVTLDNISTINSGSITGFEWDFGNQTTSSDFEPSVTYPVGGNYMVSLTARSDKGCESTGELSDSIEVLVTPTADFAVIPGDSLTMLDPTIRLQNLSANASTYAWAFGDGETIGTPNPSHSYAEVGEYTITLTAYNGNCTDVALTEIRIDPETFIYAPNAFTPNGDGKNDVFYAVGIGIESFEIFVFDRWGKELFHTADITNGWDGSHLGKNAPVGVYPYRIEIINALGERETIMGHVTLIR